MNKDKLYDLEERTFKFSDNVRSFIGKLPNSLRYSSDVKQLLRSSGSVAANYIEANESLSKKDFFHRIKSAVKKLKKAGFG